MSSSSASLSRLGTRAVPGGIWILVARFRGVGLHVSPLLLVPLVLLLVWLGPPEELVLRARVAGVLLLGVLVHEIGHAVVARRRGLRVAGVYLHWVSFAYVERGRPLDEMRVALGGPAASLLAGGVLCAVAALLGEVREPYLENGLDRPWLFAAGVQLLMGMLNLLPALPADGGRALRAWVSSRRGPVAAARGIAVSGVCVGLLIGIAGAWIVPTHAPWLLLVGAYFAWVGVREWRGALGAMPRAPQTLPSSSPPLLGDASSGPVDLGA